MTKRTKCFQCHITDFNQLDYVGQMDAVSNLVPLISNTGDMRLLSYSLPWQSRRWKQQRARLAQLSTHAWQRRGYQEEIRLGTLLSEGRALQTINHYLVLPDTLLEAGHLGAWGIVARETTPPPPLSGEYAAGLDYLWPVRRDAHSEMVEDRTRPYATILASHRFKEGWDWLTPLAKVLTEASGPMVLCLDVRAISQKKVEMATNSLQATASGVTKVSDKEVLLKLETADFILSQMAQGMGLHHVRLYIMLIDRNLERLKTERLPELTNRLSSHMGIESLYGYQAGAAAVFTPQFPKLGSKQNVPGGHHNVLSDGVAVMAGGMLGFYSNDKYDGIYVGTRRSITGQFAGLHYLDFWQGQSAAHMGIFGQTGSGKTVAAQAMLARELEQGTQVIVMEPQGHSRRLAQLIGADNCRYVQVGYGMTLNPLDVVEQDYREQVDYFIALLELLLNPRSNDPGRPRRYLSNMEIAAVSEALSKSYRGCSLDELRQHPERTPTMEIFCARLAQLAGGGELAAELRRLYVDGPWAATFNAPSSLNMRLRRADGSQIPAVIFDFSTLPEERRTLFYFSLLASVNREIRKSVPYGQKRPRRLFFIDEAHYLMSDSNLAVWLAKQFKTARTFRTGFWVADQDPMTLIGLRGAGSKLIDSAGHDAMSGLYMLNNMPYIMCLHLSLEASRELAEIHNEFKPSHLHYLSKSGPGQAVIKSGAELYIVDMVLRPSEEASLLGS